MQEGAVHHFASKSGGAKLAQSSSLVRDGVVWACVTDLTVLAGDQVSGAKSENAV